jgi:TolA-binding protein
MKQQQLEAQVAQLEAKVAALHADAQRLRQQRDVAEHQLTHAVQQHGALFTQHERAIAALAHYAIVAAEEGQSCSGI